MEFWRKRLGIDLGLVVPVVLAVFLSVISLFALRFVIDTKNDAVLNHAPDLISIQSLVIDLEELNEYSRGYLFTSRKWRRPRLYEMMLRRQTDLLVQMKQTGPLLKSEPGEEMFEESVSDANDYLVHLHRALALQRSGASVSQVSALFDRDVAPRYAALLRVLRDLTMFKRSQLQAAILFSESASEKATRLIFLSGLIAVVLCAILSVTLIRAVGRVRDVEKTLRETLQIRDEFLSVASHELKNPLTALLLQLELLGRQIMDERNPLQAEQRLVMGRCLQETRRISGLIDELLDLTRLRVGRLFLERCQTDLGALVDEVAKAQSAEARSRGCTIEVDVKEAVVGVWDPMRVSQVAYNLISNAIKYGGGKPIQVSVRNDPRGMASLVVRDQGIGIPRDIQDKIFRRFERGAVRKEIRGLGLGLYIVRQIVDAHGGRVFVQSTLGKGSTFTVELPYAEAGATPQEIRAA